MNEDLTHRLRATADDGGRPFAPIAEVLAAGRRRHRRRTALAAAGGSVGALATGLAVAGLVGAMVGGSGTPAPDGAPDATAPPASPGPQQQAAYDPTPVPGDEAVDRCVRRLGLPDTGWQLDTFGVGDPVAVNAFDGPYAAGEIIYLSDDNGALRTCNVPQPAMIDTSPRLSEPLPDSTDPAALADQCGRLAGVDLTGWQVEAMDEAQGTEAVFWDDAGYTATCSIQPPEWDSGAPPEAVVFPQSDAEVGSGGRDAYKIWFDWSDLGTKTAFTPISGGLYTAAGRLYGPRAADAAEVRVQLPDEAVVTRPVVEGRYALRLHTAEAMPQGAALVTVLDGNGRVLGTNRG